MYTNSVLEDRTSMNNTNFNTDTPLSSSVLDSQNEDVKTALNVLEAMQEDLSSDAPNWATENIEATIELLKQYKGVR